MSKNRGQKGFTLIEVLVVISVIALLASIISVFARDSREKSQIAKGQIQSSELAKAVSIGRTSGTFTPSVGSYLADEEDALLHADNPIKDEVLNGISSIPENNLNPDKNYYYNYEPSDILQCGENGTAGEPMIVYKIEGNPKSNERIVGEMAGGSFLYHIYVSFGGTTCYPTFPSNCESELNLACDTSVQVCEQTSSTGGYFGCTPLK